MGTVQKAVTLSDFHDGFRHLFRVKVFTPVCVCFPLEDELSRPRIIDVLSGGLGKLAAGFPWLGGMAAAEADTGLPSIIPGEQRCKLIVKDLTNDSAIPCMDVLRTGRYPFSMLDEKLLTPLNTLPTSWQDDPVPILILQANFIRGGLLLCFVGEHSTMDGVGLGYVMHMLSQACHDIPFTAEELLHGNSIRTNIVPLLDQAEFKMIPELDHVILINGAYRMAGYQMPKCTWAYFHFCSNSLSQLKMLASTPGSVSDGPVVPYVTTNDALTAFIWKFATKARATHLPPDAKSMCVRAVDVRSCFSISPYYLGNMTHHTYKYISASSAGSIPLGELASSLRSALNPADLAHGSRSLVTFIATSEDKSKISWCADLNIESDLWVSSWAKLDSWKLDFNLGLGLPEAVRVPRTRDREGMIYLMPMDRLGGIDAAICLSSEDMERLAADAEWKQYASWIG